MGYEKGRKDIISNFSNICKNQGISTNIILLMKDSNKRVGITENLINISKSKALLEILQDGQKGDSLRFMESLYFKKKLITNNIMIKTNRFYHKNNIFIFGIDDIDHLKEFLSLEYYDFGTDIHYFDIENWCKRFI